MARLPRIVIPGYPLQVSGPGSGLALPHVCVGRLAWAVLN